MLDNYILLIFFKLQEKENAWIRKLSPKDALKLSMVLKCFLVTCLPPTLVFISFHSCDIRIWSWNPRRRNKSQNSSKLFSFFFHLPNSLPSSKRLQKELHPFHKQSEKKEIRRKKGKHVDKL
ncbi:CLUMA_CG005621, isoform A [Clunio marinus]|uniref:CLUMA_CG005621, isoform A n=1 Tax=Clunio marinus TaxID=568069 RepID=A0A1J1I0Z5_9DIPT|nr:CLUMA_CG005621, isoform A [Clunio marinus]